MSETKTLNNAVVVVATAVVGGSWNMVSQQLGDGDGDPNGVGLAAARLRDVRHTTDQVL